MIFEDDGSETDLAHAKVTVEVDDGFPRLVPAKALPPLTDEQVRDVLETGRS